MAAPKDPQTPSTRPVPQMNGPGLGAEAAAPAPRPEAPHPRGPHGTAANKMQTLIVFLVHIWLKFGKSVTILYAKFRSCINFVKFIEFANLIIKKGQYSVNI